MPALPSSLALTNIPDGSLIVAADHRTNYAAIQTATNALIAALSGGAAGQELQALSASSVGYVSTPKISASTLAGGPPGSPADGDIWLATAVDANGAIWQFRYNAGSASAYKWEFIGGTPLHVEIATSESTSSAAMVDLATVGPSITLARGGDYLARWGAIAGGAGGGNAFSQLNINGSVAGPIASADVTAIAGALETLVMESTILAAGAIVIKQQYAISNAVATTFQNRFLRLQPIRIS